MQVAKQFPNVHIDGYDISLEQIPPDAWTPKNVHFEHLDVYEDIPPRLRGRYE